MFNKFDGNDNVTIDRTQAFHELSRDYDKARPTYPPSLYATLLDSWLATHDVGDKRPLVVDVGCGTGISTRAIYHALAGKGEVVGVEPGDAMRKTAIEVTKEAIKYIDASAEQLPFENESVDIVTAAQAAQWFNRPQFYIEAKRILNKNGIIAIYENNRDWKTSEFLSLYEKFLETYSKKDDGTKYSRYYREFPYVDELKKEFNNGEEFHFSWTRQMTPEEFFTMAKSSTQAQHAIKNIGLAKAKALIIENATNYSNTEGKVEVLYDTKLIIAIK